MIFYALKSLIGIATCDKILVYLLGDKSRWFQLHALANIYTSYSILSDVIKIYSDPNTGYSIVDQDYVSYDILCLHLYHVLFFGKLKFYDYFHHILFIGLGVIPNIYFIKSNQKYLPYIACCGIPGIIEYASLSLHKHGHISTHIQKLINYYLYLFFRYPLCITGFIYNMLAHYNKLIYDWYPMSVYLNSLVLLNGAFFTHLTVRSYLINVAHTNLNVNVV